MILGFDLGGTQIKAGLVDHSGRVLATRKEPTPTDIAGARAMLAEKLRTLADGGFARTRYWRWPS